MSKTRSKTDSTLRVGPMVNVLPLLQSFNCDPGMVFDHIDFSPGDLENMEARITYRQANALLNQCVKATRCEHFGLLLGQMAEPSHLGLGGLVTYVAPTVKLALNGVIEMFDLHEESASLSLEIGARHCRFSYAMLEAVTGIECINDLATAFMCTLMREICGEHWSPTAVWISRREPLDVSPYNRFFQAPVYFDAPDSAVGFETRWLEQPLQHPDPARYRLIGQESAAMHERQDHAFIDSVPNALRRGLLVGRYSAHEIAGALDVHERTLRRRLNAAGTSFRQELDAVRWSFGTQLLEGTNMPVRDVAVALGYTQASSFIRAFERWCGTSPALWRKQHNRSMVAQDRVSLLVTPTRLPSLR